MKCNATIHYRSRDPIECCQEAEQGDTLCYFHGKVRDGKCDPYLGPSNQDDYLWQGEREGPTRITEGGEVLWER